MAICSVRCVYFHHFSIANSVCRHIIVQFPTTVRKWFYMNFVNKINNWRCIRLCIAFIPLRCFLTGKIIDREGEGAYSNGEPLSTAPKSGSCDKQEQTTVQPVFKSCNLAFFLGPGLTRFCIFLFSLRSRCSRTLQQYVAPDLPSRGRQELTRGKWKPPPFPRVNSFSPSQPLSAPTKMEKSTLFFLFYVMITLQVFFFICSFRFNKVIATIVVDVFMK